jgi:WD40 repeat protein
LHAASPTQIAFAPDGATFTSFDGALHLWDPVTGRERRRIETGVGNGIGHVQFAYAANGQLLAVRAQEERGEIVPGEGRKAFGWIDLCDPRTGRKIRRFEGNRIPDGLALSPDGRVVAGAAYHEGKPIITLWDAASGRVIGRIDTLPNSPPRPLAFLPDGKVSMACVSWWQSESKYDDLPGRPEESTIYLWEVAIGKEIRRIGMGRMRINEAVLAPDGKTLATATTDKTIRLWDVASGRVLRRFSLPGTPDDQFVSCADLSPDGKTLATSADDGLLFWDAATGDARRGVAKSPLVPKLVTKLVKSLRFAPDGKSVATIGGHWVRIWDLATAKETRRIVMPNAPPWRPGAPPRPPLDVGGSGAYLAFSPDGKVLAASSQQDGQICLLDMASGEEFARLDGPKGLKAVAFSPDGKILATGIETSKKRGRDLGIRLWDVAAQRDLCRVKAHRSGICALAFSPDGRRLLSASADATALVWDVAALIGRKTSPAVERIGEGIRRERGVAAFSDD